MQPEVNIGLVGHVDHGKTTLTQQLSGKWTDTHSEELKRGITIRLGYADATIRKVPGKKGAEQWTVHEKVGGKKTEEVRTISLIDAPGHESLMATMLAGASIMDGAILLIAANEHCPQPQTVEHLMALDIAGIKNLVVVQNKIDLVTAERAQKNHEQIKKLLSTTTYKDAPVIPVSATHGINIDLLIEALQEHIPTPKRDSKAASRFYVARSFDTNKPGTKPAGLKGGVLGGAVVRGVFKVGDEVEIRPGHMVEVANKRVAHPLQSKLVSLQSGNKEQKELKPGGSSGMMTLLDPSIVKSDTLAGSMVGRPGSLPEVWYSLKLRVHLLDRVVGLEDSDSIEPLKMNELLMLNAHSAATVGVITGMAKGVIDVSLRMPVCAEEDEKVAISRRIGTRFRLIGYGVVEGGRTSP